MHLDNLAILLSHGEPWHDMVLPVWSSECVLGKVEFIGCMLVQLSV